MNRNKIKIFITALILVLFGCGIFYGARADAIGTMTTYTGTGSGPDGIAFDGANMWTANYYGSSVTKIAPGGSMTTYTGTGSYPIGIAFDGTNMWTANYEGSSVTKVAPDGTMTDYEVDLYPQAIAFDGTNMWTAN